MKSSYKIALMVSALICLLVVGYYTALNDTKDADPTVSVPGSPNSSSGIGTGPTPAVAQPARPATADNLANQPSSNMDDLMSRVRSHLATPEDAGTGTTPSASTPAGTVIPPVASTTAVPPASAGTPTQGSNPHTLTLDGSVPPEARTAAATPGLPAATPPQTIVPPASGAASVASAPTSIGSGQIVPIVPTRPAAATAATTTTVPPATRPLATAAQPTPAAAAPGTYTIKSGDTLSGIATRLYNNEARWVEIAQANPLVDPTRLKVGQVLRLPGASAPASNGGAANGGARTAAPAAAAGAAGTYTVKSGDTLSSIALRTLGDRGKWRAIYNLNRQTIGPNENNIEEGMVLKLPPK